MEIRPEYEITVWRCSSCGMMLGDVVRTNGIRRLTLYRQDGNTASIAAIITGSAEITCPDCRTVRTWFAPEEGLKEFIRREIQRHRRELGLEP